MTITLTPETENRLLQQAARSGKDVNSFVEALISDGLSEDAFISNPDHLTEDQIAEIRVGIGRGLEAAEAGRVKALAQAVEEARQRHGFPATWASGVDGTR